VADESVAALDVSIQADVLNLLKSIQADMGLTFLFISHDLSVVAHTCDHVAVMYLGRIVESAPTRQLFRAPKHPYTKALFSAIPSLDPDDRGRAQKLIGEIPSARMCSPHAWSLSRFWKAWTTANRLPVTAGANWQASPVQIGWHDRAARHRLMARGQKRSQARDHRTNGPGTHPPKL
jgi:oligopeptide/dipeptide ABC transporter ATP-binding protein